MKNIILQSRHQRVAVQVSKETEVWTPVAKQAVPDGHVSNSTERASRVFDETWEIRGNHLVRVC